jgi:hypothetical protein
VDDSETVERLADGDPRLGLGAIAGREVRNFLDEDGIPRRQIEHFARREDRAAACTSDVLRAAVGETEKTLGVDHERGGVRDASRHSTMVPGKPGEQDA